MEIVVRDYSGEDYDEVNRILKETFGYEKSKNRDTKSYEFVGVLDNNVVGYFILNEMKDIIRDFIIYHVDYVCVDEKYRSQGIGRKMMEYAIEYAKKNKAFRLELTSSNKRVAAHKLYLSLGFEIRDSAIFRKELLW